MLCCAASVLLLAPVLLQVIWRGPGVQSTHRPRWSCQHGPSGGAHPGPIHLWQIGQSRAVRGRWAMHLWHRGLLPRSLGTRISRGSFSGGFGTQSTGGRGGGAWVTVRPAVLVWPSPHGWCCRRWRGGDGSGVVFRSGTGVGVSCEAVGIGLHWWQTGGGEWACLWTWAVMA